MSASEPVHTPAFTSAEQRTQWLKSCFTAAEHHNQWLNSCSLGAHSALLPRHDRHTNSALGNMYAHALLSSAQRQFAEVLLSQ
jgi:hypothetical protein